jgi:hypothetical protein
MLGVKEASHLQRTLNTLLAASHIQTERSEEEDLSYYRIVAPSGLRPVEISYTFISMGTWLSVPASRR